MLNYRNIVKTPTVWRTKWLFRKPYAPVVRRKLASIREAPKTCQTSDKQQNVEENAVNFNDTKGAYRSKTTREILRALLVFRLCSINFLVDNNLKVCLKC